VGRPGLVIELDDVAHAAKAEPQASSTDGPPSVARAG
jgi:hypothetical protein